MGKGEDFAIMKGMKEYDFVAIGDITIDAFIRLKDARVHCDINNEKCELCVRFGEKIPYESVEEVAAVGNSPNAAVSGSRLGLSSALVTHLGSDENGKKCIASLEKDGVSTAFVETDPHGETNYHYVLWYEDERTILVKHHEYTRSFPDIGSPGWVYLSSLGADTLLYHEEIADYLEKNPHVKLAFQPGTFQLHLGAEKLKRIYRRSAIFFCNKGEAQLVLKTREDDIKKLLAGITDLGPSHVVITDGPKGAYAYDRENFWMMPIYPDPKPPLQRTGAGDAFSSTVVSALALGESFERALTWGPVNSMSVVQYVGAQRGLLTRAQIEGYLKSAPADYKPQKI